MADTKISTLTALTGVNLALADLLTIVDVSDTTMAASGTNKKMTFEELLAALASRYASRGYAEIVGNILNFTSVSDIAGLSVTWNMISGIRYKVTARVRTAQSAVGGTQSLLLTNAANVQVDADVVDVVANATSTRSISFSFVAASSVSNTFKLRLAASAGDVDVIASGLQPASLLIEAIG